MTDETLRTGLTDRAELLDSSDAEVIDELGHIDLASHQILGNTEAKHSVGSGAFAPYVTTEFFEFNGSIDIRTDTFRALKFIGNDDDAGTIDFEEHNHLYTFRQATDDGKIEEIQYFRFGEAILEIDEDNEMTIRYTGQGKDSKRVNGTINKRDSSVKPKQYDKVFLDIDDTQVGTLQRFRGTINRNLRAVRGINTGTKKPKYLALGKTDVDVEIVFKIDDGVAWEQFHDGEEIQEDPAPSKITLRNSDGTDKIDFEGHIGSEVDFEMPNDDETRTASLTGIARKPVVTYPTE